jgi:hypothetical protein
MPRQAREKKLYSFYKIVQVCQSNDTIFKKSEDRQLLVHAFLSAKEKYNFKLLGLNIDQGGYELILFDNGTDISKIMRSINISFTMKYKCQHDQCDQIFKERYQSEIIQKDHVQDYLDQLGRCDHLDPTWLDSLDLQACGQGECIDCINQAKKKIEQELTAMNLSLEDLEKNKKVRNEMIKGIRKNSSLSLKEIGDLFGGLSESAICKILSR